MLEAPRCYERGCRHLTGAVQPQEDTEAGERPCCAAFPQGIPVGIAYGDDLHLTPREGQGNDVAFERA